VNRVDLCASATATAFLRPVTLAKQGLFGRVNEGLATCVLNDALRCSCIRAGRNQTFNMAVIKDSVVTDKDANTGSPRCCVLLVPRQPLHLHVSAPKPVFVSNV